METLNRLQESGLSICVAQHHASLFSNAAAAAAAVDSNCNIFFLSIPPTSVRVAAYVSATTSAVL